MKEPSKYWIELAKMSGKAKRPVDLIERRVEDLVSRTEYAIDLERADNGEIKTQNQWINWHNSNDSIMASTPDVYRSAEDDAIAEALREDSREHWFVSSTRIAYQPDNLNAKITHYFGSEVAEPIEKEVEIPEYLGVTLDEVLSTSEGLAYMQALFDTYDNEQEITETLESLSKKTGNEIKVWTPPLESNSYTTRSAVPERPVIFYYNVADFRVDCYDHPGEYGGVSRGVTKAA